MNDRPPERPSSRRHTRDAALLALFVFVGVLAFSSRAVYIDEPIFLELARSALENPLFPSDTPLLFFGIERADFASHTHPPVGEYYLALVTWLLPEFSEVAYRLLFSLFPVVAAVAFYTLARRWTAAPFAVSLLFASSPAFFVMSPTLMMDIPTLAFLLAGFSLFLDHRDGKRNRLVPAAACFILAAGTSYTALVPIGCLLLWVLASGPKAGECLAILSAPVSLALWLVLMTLHFGRFPLADTVAFFTTQPRSTLGNVAATFSFLGGVTLFPGSALALVDLRSKQRSMLVAAAAGLALALTGFFDWRSWPYRLWFVALAAAGIFLLGTLGLQAAAKMRRYGWPAGFLVTWAAGVLVFFVVVGDMINARYVLLAIPPVYLIAFGSVRPKAAVGVAGLTLALSLALAVADARFVGAYRTWVTEIVRPLQERGFRVWGAVESGLRFYLEQTGAETLAADALSPVGGDFIVRDRFGYGLDEELSLVLVGVRSDGLVDRFPLRTFNPDAGAGFHDSRFGMVPYTWSRVPHDRIALTQLSPLVERLPQPVVSGRSRPAWSSEGPVLIQTEEMFRVAFDPPPESELRFELQGEGEARMTDGFIELERQEPGPIVWRNLRVVPGGFDEARGAGN